MLYWFVHTNRWEKRRDGIDLLEISTIVLLSTQLAHCPLDSRNCIKVKFNE